MTNNSGLGAMMAGGNPASGRQINDFYSTPSDVTKVLLKEYPMNNYIVWEPCCGSGAMTNILEENNISVFSSDIDPQGCGIMMNILETSVIPNNCNAIITNPPFNIAEQIIRHTWIDLKIDWMALVLKSTYWHSVRRQKLWNECKPTAIHPLTWRPDFMELGRPTMEVMWCVWDKYADDNKVIYKPLNR